MQKFWNHYQNNRFLKLSELFSNCLKYCTTRMSEESIPFNDGSYYSIKKIKEFTPKLSRDLHKGQCGRIGIIGGSVEYTGAPYFSAISALKLGADLVYVFCCKEAAPVIKSYSPELIVLPILDREDTVREIETWLSRLHALVIGPGLGREPGLLKNVGSIINHCKEKMEPSPPLIIDADGLYLVTENLNLIKNYPAPVILTPNPAEYSRLSSKLSLENSFQVAVALSVVLVEKGFIDIITNGILGQKLNLSPDFVTFVCSEKGSFRRCGGQGDILCGCLGTFVAWLQLHKVSVSSTLSDLKELNKNDKEKWFEQNYMGFSAAAYGACLITKTCSALAFDMLGRSMTASDMIQLIPKAYKLHFDK